MACPALAGLKGKGKGIGGGDNFNHHKDTKAAKVRTSGGPSNNPNLYGACQ